MIVRIPLYRLRWELRVYVRNPHLLRDQRAVRCEVSLAQAHVG